MHMALPMVLTLHSGPGVCGEPFPMKPVASGVRGKEPIPVPAAASPRLAFWLERQPCFCP